MYFFPMDLCAKWKIHNEINNVEGIKFENLAEGETEKLKNCMQTQLTHKSRQ